MERGRGTLMDHENFEIIKTLVASTGHSTTHDLDTLENTNLGYCAYSTEYGIRVYLDDDIISRMKLEGTNLSEALSLLVIFAVSNNCSYLELDSDGPIYDSLTIYDW